MTNPQVHYDPSEVKFEELLEVFFGRIDPTQKDGQGGDWGTQYRTGVYYHTDEQEATVSSAMRLCFSCLLCATLRWTNLGLDFLFYFCPPPASCYIVRFGFPCIILAFPLVLLVLSPVLSLVVTICFCYLLASFFGSVRAGNTTYRRKSLWRESRESTRGRWLLSARKRRYTGRQR